MLRETKEFKIFLLEIHDDITKNIGINVTIDKKFKIITFNIFSIVSEILQEEVANIEFDYSPLIGFKGQYLTNLKYKIDKKHQGEM